MYIIFCVIDNQKYLDKVLTRWYEIGITGVTIIESAGIQRRRAKFLNIPMRYNFPNLPADIKEGNITLFALVDTEDIIYKCIDATEEIVGDLNNPFTGVITAWPVIMSKGIHKPHVDDEK